MKVKCCDGVVLKLEDALVYASSTVKKLILENISSRGCSSVCLFGASQGENCEINFAVEISSKTLLKINEYVKTHAEAGDNEKSLCNWDLEFIKVDSHTLFALVLAANYLNIRDLLDLSCEAVMAKNGMVPEKEEEYQGTTIGKEKGKNIMSEEVLAKQCSMEDRGGINTVNLINGGSSKWGNVPTSLKLHLENMSVKRLSDVEVAKLAEDYRACRILQCLATVLKPMKNKGMQTVTNRKKKELGIFTKCDRFVKAARGGCRRHRYRYRHRRRNVRERENFQQQYF